MTEGVIHLGKALKALFQTVGKIQERITQIEADIALLKSYNEEKEQ